AGLVPFCLPCSLLHSADEKVVKTYRVLDGHVKKDGGNNYVGCLVLIEDNKVLLSGAEDGTVRVTDVATGKDTWIVEHADERVRVIVALPDASLFGVATIPHDGSKPDLKATLRIYDISKHKLLWSMSMENACCCLAVSPDGKMLATESQKKGSL